MALQARLRDLMASAQQYETVLQQTRTEICKLLGALELLAEQLKEAEVPHVHDGDLSRAAGNDSPASHGALDPAHLADQSG